jgi:hypothetical protein
MGGQSFHGMIERRKSAHAAVVEGRGRWRNTGSAGSSGFKKFIAPKGSRQRKHKHCR